MKRLSPNARNEVIHSTVENLVYGWLCRYGKWNQEKLIQDLEKCLRKLRLENDNEG